MKIFCGAHWVAVAAGVWFLSLSGENAGAQETGRFRGESSRAPMKRASQLIRRQAPPVVDRGLEGVINPGNSSVVISLSRQRAFLLTGGQVYVDTPISSGKRAGSTPTGNFGVLEKHLDHRSSIYGDFVDRQGRVVRSGISLKVDSAPSGTRYRGAAMKYFCRLTWTGIGMHGGILPGYAASHGCIRLPTEMAALIYRNVKIGTPVTIER